MGSHVLGESILATKTVVVNLTLESHFTSVGSQVIGKSTDVDPHMLNKINILRKALITCIALVLLFTSVGSHMY